MLMVQKVREKKNVGAASAARRWAEENELGRLIYIDAALRRVAACAACPATAGWHEGRSGHGSPSPPRCCGASIGTAKKHQMSWCSGDSLYSERNLCVGIVDSAWRAEQRAHGLHGRTGKKERSQALPLHQRVYNLRTLRRNHRRSSAFIPVSLLDVRSA